MASTTFYIHTLGRAPPSPKLSFWTPNPPYLIFYCLMDIPQAPKAHSSPTPNNNENGIIPQVPKPEHWEIPWIPPSASYPFPINFSPSALPTSRGQTAVVSYQSKSFPIVLASNFTPSNSFSSLQPVSLLKRKYICSHLC